MIPPQVASRAARRVASAARCCAARAQHRSRSGGDRYPSDAYRCDHAYRYHIVAAGLSSEGTSVTTPRLARLAPSAADLAGDTVRLASAARPCSSALLASPVITAAILPSSRSAPFTPLTQLTQTRGSQFASGISMPRLSSLAPLTEAAVLPLTPLTRLTQTRGSQFASGFSMPLPKRLEEIMSVEALRASTPEEITATWNNHHLGRTHVSTVIPAAAFETLQHRAKVCPMFVLPMARTNGFVTMLAQAQMPHLLFTGLEDYKVRGPSASPFFTVTHYTDLAAEKGLVLVRGDVVLPNKLSDDEARTLLKDLHSFYTDDSRYRHVEAFNKHPTEFDYRAVVRALGIVATGW
ncbi:hypothetical protein CLOM_g22866 [Closterium sp. NIES-68]|nr:hypothetical protein CLOM_g22866 [Closterium sp. NIES-68]GJP65500.1 hypothetical protein CLOP_g22385 [Closterium sp. NIES-67]GJP70310.1 hypothetical protein CLOP_g1257 [Closterium sp. NIES-67]